MSELSKEEKEIVLLGAEAEDFSGSELGKAVFAMVEADVNDATLAFADVDVTDQKKVAAVQQDLRVAMALKKYLHELIVRGRETYQASKREE